MSQDLVVYMYCVHESSKNMLGSNVDKAALKDWSTTVACLLRSAGWSFLRGSEGVD